MKRLLFLVGLLISNPALAYIVSVDTVSSDIAVVNNNFSNVVAGVNHIDGSTDGGATVSNIAADSVYEINMADDANSRVFANELLGIGSDSVAAGVLVQSSIVESGCVPADDTDLTSDISACIAYVNGFRISKGATSLTYTASRDCYVDLSQTGVYTVTCVSNGATQPAVAANSVRLSKVVTDGTQISTVTSVYTTRVPGLIIPAHYRTGMIVSKDSTTTITVLPGSYEINNSIITKVAPTTLTVSTAGDYASGSSERAASKFGFVLGDASGNIKLDVDDPPSYDNYAVSTSTGKLRYDTYHSTVYRALGWFYLDAAQLVESASNIKEFDLPNYVQSNDTGVASLSSTTFTDVSKVNFYNSGGPILLTHNVSGDAAGGGLIMTTEFARSGTTLTGTGASLGVSNAENHTNSASYVDENRPQGTVSYTTQARVNTNSTNMRRRNLTVREM